MLYFLLPKNNNFNLYKKINYSSNNISYSTEPLVSSSLSYFLNDVKKQIDEYKEEWDIYKKYTNPYEYIHSNLPTCIYNKINVHSDFKYLNNEIKYKKNIINGNCLSFYKPLSRSYFKMIEIIKTFNIEEIMNYISEDIVQVQSSSSQCFPDKRNSSFITNGFCKPPPPPPQKTTDSFLYSGIPQKRQQSNYYNMQNEFGGCGSTGGELISKKINTFHLAEGPGGFIEAIVNLRNNPYDTYIGMTLINNKNPNIPSWKKSLFFLNNNKNVFIENGFDKKGDILNFENFKYCVAKYGSSMHLITGDGGFDFSSDFNNQEMTIIQLLFAQVAFAVCMQKQGGVFILKIFDCFFSHTVDILYLLSSFYVKVYICKPQTSRVANSEKYIVCINFLPSSNIDFYPYFYLCFEKMRQKTKSNTERFLNVNISNAFLTKLEEYNSIIGHQQIENIYNTINLIKIKQKNKFDKINTLIKNNIQKSIYWCDRYL